MTCMAKMLSYEKFEIYLRKTTPNLRKISMKSCSFQSKIILYFCINLTIVFCNVLATDPKKLQNAFAMVDLLLVIELFRCLKKFG